jgi:very-short-patch-repair endonuclease
VGVTDQVAPVSAQAARILRDRGTPAEQQLWQLLRDRQLEGFKFRRQHNWNQLVLDLYCAEAKLVIELDGAGHLDAEQHARDHERTRLLENRGLRILRFWNQEVLEDGPGVLARIAAALRATPPIASLPPAEPT